MAGAGTAVRAAAPRDLEAVAAIYAHWVATSTVTFDEVAPAVDGWRRRHAELAAAGLPFLVAEADGAVCGYALCAPWKPRAGYRHTAEDSVYVAPQAIGRGVGGELLDELLVRCADAGVRQLIAVVASPGGEAAVRLHTSRRFRRAGVLRAVGRKHGRLIDTLLLQRAVDAPAPAVPGSRGPGGRSG